MLRYVAINFCCAHTLHTTMSSGYRSVSQQCSLPCRVSVLYSIGDMIMKTLTTTQVYVLILSKISEDFCRGLIDSQEYKKYLEVYHRRAADGTLLLDQYDPNVSSSIYLVIGI